MKTSKASVIQSNGIVNNIIIWGAAYIAAQIFADIGSLKIITLFGFSMDAGTLVYPITFTLRDIVHKLIGAKKTRLLIYSAAVINLVMAGFFWLVGALQADPSVTQADFAALMSPVWRIVIASIVAEVIAELVDTEAYIWWTKITPKYQWARVLISNMVSVPLDSLAFCWLAFGGVLPNEVLWSIFWANVILKLVVTVVSIPGVYLVKEHDPDLIKS